MATFWVTLPLAASAPAIRASFPFYQDTSGLGAFAQVTFLLEFYSFVISSAFVFGLELEPWCKLFAIVALVIRSRCPWCASQIPILPPNSLRTEILIPTTAGSVGGWQRSARSLSGKCPWLKRHSPKDHVSAQGSRHPVTTDVGLKWPAPCLYSRHLWGAVSTLEAPWGIIWNFC